MPKLIFDQTAASLPKIMDTPMYILFVCVYIYISSTTIYIPSFIETGSAFKSRWRGGTHIIALA
jgi:hypothetical protein